jgi:hypothetical protein
MMAQYNNYSHNSHVGSNNHHGNTNVDRYDGFLGDMDEMAMLDHIPVDIDGWFDLKNLGGASTNSPIHRHHQQQHFRHQQQLQPHHYPGAHHVSSSGPSDELYLNFDDDSQHANAQGISGNKRNLGPGGGKSKKMRTQVDVSSSEDGAQHLAGQNFNVEEENLRMLSSLHDASTNKLLTALANPNARIPLHYLNAYTGSNNKTQAGGDTDPVRSKVNFDSFTNAGGLQQSPRSPFRSRINDMNSTLPVRQTKVTNPRHFTFEDTAQSSANDGPAMGLGSHSSDIYFGLTPMASSRPSTYRTTQFNPLSSRYNPNGNQPQQYFLSPTHGMHNHASNNNYIAANHASTSALLMSPGLSGMTGWTDEEFAMLLDAPFLTPRHSAGVDNSLLGLSSRSVDNSHVNNGTYGGHIQPPSLNNEFSSMVLPSPAGRITPLGSHGSSANPASTFSQADPARLHSLHHRVSSNHSHIPASKSQSSATFLSLVSKPVTSMAPPAPVNRGPSGPVGVGNKTFPSAGTAPNNSVGSVYQNLPSNTIGGGPNNLTELNISLPSLSSMGYVATNAGAQFGNKAALYYPPVSNLDAYPLHLPVIANNDFLRGRIYDPNEVNPEESHLLALARASPALSSGSSVSSVRSSSPFSQLAIASPRPEVAAVPVTEPETLQEHPEQFHSNSNGSQVSSKANFMPGQPVPATTASRFKGQYGLQYNHQASKAIQGSRNPMLSLSIGKPHLSTPGTTEESGEVVVDGDDRNSMLFDTTENMLRLLGVPVLSATSFARHRAAAAPPPALSPRPASLEITDVASEATTAAEGSDKLRIQIPQLSPASTSSLSTPDSKHMFRVEELVQRMSTSSRRLYDIIAVLQVLDVVRSTSLGQHAVADKPFVNVNWALRGYQNLSIVKFPDKAAEMGVLVAPSPMVSPVTPNKTRKYATESTDKYGKRWNQSQVYCVELLQLYLCGFNSLSLQDMMVLLSPNAAGDTGSNAADETNNAISSLLSLGTGFTKGSTGQRSNTGSPVDSGCDALLAAAVVIGSNGNPDGKRRTLKDKVSFSDDMLASGLNILDCRTVVESRPDAYTTLPTFCVGLESLRKLMLRCVKFCCLLCALSCSFDVYS